MKSNRLNRIVRLTGATIALAAILGYASSARAQYKATGEDGIAASPKFRQLLNEQHRHHQSAVVPIKTSAMGCSKCEDKVTTRSDPTARGANKPVVQVTTHLCGTCGSVWNVVGAGKAKQLVASHTCGSCGAGKSGM